MSRIRAREQAESYRNSLFGSKGRKEAAHSAGGRVWGVYGAEGLYVGFGELALTGGAVSTELSG